MLIDELQICASILLHAIRPASCANLDADGSRSFDVVDVQRAAEAFLFGCGGR